MPSGLDAFRGLQFQPLLVAAADVLADLVGFVLAGAQSLDGAAAEEKTSSAFPARIPRRGRNDRLWIPGHRSARRPSLGIFRADEIDDLVGHFLLLGADGDNLGLLDAGCRSTSSRVPSPK